MMRKMRHVHPSGNHREKQCGKGEMTHVLNWQGRFQLVEQKDAKNELGQIQEKRETENCHTFHEFLFEFKPPFSSKAFTAWGFALPKMQKILPQSILFKKVQEGQTSPVMSLFDFFSWFLKWLRILFPIYRFSGKGIEIKTIVHSVITTSLIQQILDVVDVGANPDHRVVAKTLQMRQYLSVTHPMTACG